MGRGGAWVLTEDGVGWGEWWGYVRGRRGTAGLIQARVFSGFYYSDTAPLCLCRDCLPGTQPTSAYTPVGVVGGGRGWVAGGRGVGGGGTEGEKSILTWEIAADL